MPHPGAAPDARRAPLWLRRSRLVAFGCGALAATGLAPLALWPLALAGFAGLFVLARAAATPRAAAWIGWAGGSGYFLLALNWIVEPFLVDIARHGWMAPFALPLLAAGLALFWAAAMAAARALGGGALAWTATLVAAELARSYVFTGFPWALIGHGLIAAPAVQLAALAGPHALSALMLVGAVGLAALALGQRGRAVAALALFGLAQAGGLWLAARPLPAPADGAGDAAAVIRLIQPNAPQHEKWDETMAPVFFRRQVAFTAAPPLNGAPRPDLVIWPETAIPLLLNEADAVLQIVAEAAAGPPVVIGMNRVEGTRIYNAAIRLDTAQGQAAVGAIYDKHHLVPFGEYMPFGDALARIGIHGLAASAGRGFSAGPGPQLMTLPGVGQALPLICYEAVFPRHARAPGGARPRMLLQITNDAWFGRFSGPYQHLAQARLRAVEQGLPMVRVANTGVSAMIDARGRITGQIALGQAGWLDVALPPAAPPTPYGQSGDWPVLALLALVLMWLAGRAARQSLNLRKNGD